MQVPIHRYRVRRRTASRGLSTVEVLIAVAVIAFGLLAVVGTLGWVSKTNAKLRYQQTTQSLIESELAQLEADPRLPMRPYTYTRNVGRPYSILPEGSQLTVYSEPYPRSNEPRLRRVRVEIRWGSPGDPLSGRLVRERLICLR